MDRLNAHYLTNQQKVTPAAMFSFTRETQTTHKETRVVLSEKCEESRETLKVLMFVSPSVNTEIVQELWDSYQ